MEQAEFEAAVDDVASPDALSIQLLGGFSVSVGPRAIEPAAWRLRKASHLLKLLALAPQYRMHQEQVLDTLWPHLDVDAASKNLRVTLHFARKLLVARPARDQRHDDQHDGEELLSSSPPVAVPSA